ncbi:MAG: PIG-L family deacetylase [Anaerolineales bacterium]|jgi:LmbE family N-acetylglucosaminyl deacetylase
MKNWVFLSAHFDDVVLSAGGLVWELARGGDHVEIWTICAGDPPADKPLTEYAQLLHGFWNIGEDVPLKRSREDATCCKVLGVTVFRRYTVPDNIYRYLPGIDTPVIRENEDQFKPLEPAESYLIPPVRDFICKNLPADCELVAPLAIGSHRDHILTRRAAERTGLPLWHYVDYPYLVYGEHVLSDWLPARPKIYSLEISPAGLKAWQDGFACQRSQIPLLYVDEDDMRASIEKYLRSGFGFSLWQF